MRNVKLSSNYQVVIPKEVRKKLGLQKGQLLYVDAIGKNSVSFTTKSPLDRYYGALKGAWAEDAVEYQRGIREEMEPNP